MIFVGSVVSQTAPFSVCILAMAICHGPHRAPFVVSKAKDERGAVVSVSMGSTLVIAVDLRRQWYETLEKNVRMVSETIAVYIAAIAGLGKWLNC